jgi:predicted AlkP superfamily pyrophosphatase or phosphodiesterase
MSVSIRFLLIFFLIPILARPLSAQPQNPSDRPALVVGIVVDGLHFDWIERYWDLFSEGGIKKLSRQGTNYSETSVPFVLADIGSSHASISTGAPPALHGIISRSWYNRLRKEETHCTQDNLAKTVGNSNGNGKHSADQLLAQTIGDHLILSSGYKSKVISVSLRPEASILLCGHIPGSAYWLDTRSGTWVTSSQYANSLAPWVADFNRHNSSGQYLTRDWELLLADNLYAGCPPDDNDLETGYYNQFKTFPYNLGKIRKESLGQDSEVLALVPFGNTLTTDFAIATLREEKLGTDASPDLLWISYTALDDITRRFGPDSREVADALLRLDLDIQRLIYQIEESAGKDKALIFITSTHGSGMDPDYSQALNLPGGFFRYRNAMALLNSYLNAIYGDGTWVESYLGHQVFLNETLIEQRKVSFTEIQDVSARFLTHFEGIARAIPADRMLSGQITNPWGHLIQNSYQPDRTGDLLLILQPGWIEEGNYDSDSRSPYSYDLRIPMIWYGWKVPRQTVNRPVTLLDIAPTIAHLLHIAPPDAATGNALIEIQK